MSYETIEKAVDQMVELEYSYSEYIMGNYTYESYAEHKGITVAEAKGLVTIGRRLHISNTKRVA